MTKRLVAARKGMKRMGGRNATRPTSLREHKSDGLVEHNKPITNDTRQTAG